MTETYKILGQTLTGDLALDNSTVKESILYTVPAGKQAVVSAIEITNSDTAASSYNLSFIKNNEVSNAVANINYSIDTSFDAVFMFANSGNDQKYRYATNSGNISSYIDIPNAYELFDLFYVNNEYYVLITNDKIWQNQIMSSSDGINWTVLHTFNENLNAFGYGNGKFVVLGSGSVALYSSDGINWQSGSITNVYSQWNQIIYYNNYFFAAGRSGDYGNPSVTAYSSDGINWTRQANGTFTNYPYIINDGTKLVALYADSNNNMYIKTSTDALNWSNAISIGTGSPAMRQTCIAYVNGVYVIAAAGMNNYLTSTNATTWTSHPYPLNATGLFAVGKNGNKFLLFYWDNYNTINIASSLDGITWIDEITDNGVAFDHCISVSGGTLTTLQETIPQSLNKHYIVYNKTISSGDTHEFKGGITLSEGDEIRVFSESTEIITNVYGVEIL